MTVTAEQGTRYALRRTMAASWAHLGAMYQAIEPRDMRRVGEYLSIGDLAPAHGRPLICCINGDFISRRDWWQPVRLGDVVVFAEIAGGGGNSNVGQIALMIAVAVASAYTGGYVGAAYGSGWGAVAAVGVAVVGGLLVNALYPIAQPSMGSAQAASPTYTSQLQGNQPRLGQAVPVRFGQELCYPDWGCPAYSEYDNSSYDQYYCTGLVLGLAQYNILAVYIDDTPLQYFVDAQCVIIGPGMSTRTQPTGYAGVETFAAQTLIETGMVSSVEVGGQDLVDNAWVGPYTVLKAGFKTTKLWLDMVWPRGIGTVADDGDIDARTISWQVGAQRIDDGGAPVGGWVILASESCTESTTDSVRKSYGYAVAEGRYRVRVRRISVRSDNNRHLTDMQWASLRCTITVAGVARSDVTGLVIRIRASRQLSALSQRRVRVLAQRLVPVFDGTSWSAPQFDRNPAWALADVWRDGVYGRGLADSRIDLDSLLDYAGEWEGRQDRFDYSFDTQLTTDDASQLIAAAGRARTMLRRGAVYSLVRDEPQEQAVHVFMPRNIDKDSFNLSWGLPTSSTPDAIAVTYRDGRYWDKRTVYAQIHGGQLYGYVANASGLPLRPAGVPAPKVIEEVDAPGIIGEKQALRHVMYLLARSVYRAEEGSLSADLDGLLVSMGSLVGIAHDAAEWAQSGDVTGWLSTTRVMTLSEPPIWSAGETHYVRLQADTGELGGAIEVTPGGTDYEVVLAELPAFTPSYNSPSRERTRYLFGALGEVQRQAIVAGVRPTGYDAVDVSFFIDDPRVHAADNAWLPVGDEVQDPLSDGTVDLGEEPPVFVEDFESGLSAYTLMSGSSSTFELVATPYGQSLRVNSVDSSVDHEIRRSLPAGLVLEEITVRFMMPAISEDDAGRLSIYSGADEVIQFSPKRDHTHDSSERAHLTMRSIYVFGFRLDLTAKLTTERLDANTWYLLRILITAGDSGTSASIIRLDDNEVVGVATIGEPGSGSDFSGITATHLGWSADDNGVTTTTLYDDFTINP